MTTARAITCTLILAGGLTLSLKTNALQNAGDGWWCEESTSTWDGSGWVVTAGACYYSPYSSPGESGGGGGPSAPPEGGGGGGGGGVTAPDQTDRDISAKLQCALDNYLHKDVKLTGGRTMKRVNAWAFGKQNAYGVWGYDIRNTNTSLGEDWHPVGGITHPGSNYGRIYRLAFQASSDFSRNGTLPDAPSNSIKGSVSAFEMSLFVSAHEASHLLGNEHDEAKADWYGIDAVLKYRRDNGKKCDGQ
ncbi:hypothetical protein [Thermomonas sp.]|uniref:hypothetical protein n=1 Tax=Thermomonas sp. TaxID=1971895 RepID=UPI0035B04037